jgi:hypothetical protein
MFLLCSLSTLGHGRRDQSYWRDGRFAWIRMIAARIG